MAEDPRTGYPDSGFVTITSGDGNAPQTAVQIPSDSLFRVNSVKIEYEDAATATTEVDLFDDADGTTAGNVSDQRDHFANIDADTRIERNEAEYRIFENDVLVQTDGNQDGDLSVTVHGEVLTDLKDMAGLH